MVIAQLAGASALTIAAIAAITPLLSAGDHTRSLACGTQPTPTESAVCTSRSLSALDLQIARLSSRLWSAHGLRAYGAADRSVLQEQQQEWRGARDRCAGEHRCIVEAYRRQIEWLRGWLLDIENEARG